MVEIKLTKDQREFINSQNFYERLFFLLKEENSDLCHTEFVLKIENHGTLKILKTLGLYKTLGRSTNRRILVHPRVELLIKTTTPNSEIVSKTIINLLSGKYNGIIKFNINLNEYEKLTHRKEVSELKYSGGMKTYLIKNKDNNLVKIGASGQVFKRLKNLTIQLKNDLIILGYCNINIERKLHKKFKDKNVFGEWYSLSKENILEIMKTHNFEVLEHHS